jgi:hypothetical protein
MLHAFARRKSRAYTLYTGDREVPGQRVSAEDEITSLVFGPLDFLSPSDNWTLWKSILQAPAADHRTGPMPRTFFSDFSPSACTAEFWPRQDSIEPDLLVRFRDDAGKTRALLVELKWNAGQSGPDQLKNQWLHYQAGQHADSLHVFIAKRMDLPPDTRPWDCRDGDAGLAANRLRAVRWHEFKHEAVKLAAAADTPLPLKRWAQLAAGFLGQVGIRPFVGFEQAVVLAKALPLDGSGATFWLPAVQKPNT